MLSALLGAAFIAYVLFLHRKIAKVSSLQKEWAKERARLLDLLLEGVVIIEEDQIFINSAAKKLLGANLENQTPLVVKTKDLLITCKQTGRALSDSIKMEEGQTKSFDLFAVPYENKIFFLIQDTSNAQKILDVGRDFIANASHELKTPITIIQGFAEMLQEGEDFPKEMVAEILEKIVRNCRRMDNLVKNLLTLADIENAPLAHLQPCDLVALVEESKRSILSVYPNANVEITSSSEVIAHVDPSILELAILNVLDNAIKYSQAPAKVHIQLTECLDRATISIQDEGVGISEKDLEHIFDRFYTVNKAHSRKLGGAGLGLSLVKTIIEKHEGTLNLTSCIGKGSTFTVCLPKSL